MNIPHNIICNNCVGGQLYKDTHTKYDNPFIWTLITPNDFEILYNNWDKINFSNVTLETEFDTRKHIKYFKIIIDGIISLYYPHHFEDSTYKTPTKIVTEDTQTNILCEHMDEYLVQHYHERVSRMKDAPYFILDDKYNSALYDKFNFDKTIFDKYVNKSNVLIVTKDESVKGNNVIHKERQHTIQSISQLILKNKKWNND